MQAALRHIIALIISALLVQCAMTVHAQRDVPAILVLGDSLSAAYNMDREQGWVQLLQQRLRDSGYEYRVVNASISGETTRGGLARLPAAIKQHAPLIVIIELGGNDGLRAINPQEMRSNLIRMAELAQSQDARSLILGVRIPSNYGTAYNNRFQEAYRQAAQQSGSVYLPLLLKGISDDLSLMQDDGIHPSAQAQPLLVENVWAVLEPVLDKTQARHQNPAKHNQAYPNSVSTP